MLDFYNEQTNTKTLLQSFQKQNRHFASAVHHSRQFYTLALQTDDFVSKGPFSQMIYDGIMQGEYPANIMSMHSNFYWHRMLLEDCTQGEGLCPCEWFDSVHAHLLGVL